MSINVTPNVNTISEENIAADPQGNNEHGQEMVNYGIPDQIIDQSVDVKKTIKLGRAGSPKPNRKYFNAVQSNELENFDRLNLSEREVKVWFQNRLMEENRENTTSSTANAPKTDQPYSPSQSLSSDVSSLTSHQSPPAEEDQQHSPPQSISSGVSPATSHRSHLFEDVESYLEQILERFLEQFIEFTGLDNYRLTTIDCGIPSAQAAPADYPEDTTLEDEEFDSTTHQFEYIRGLLFENYQDPMDLLNDVGNDWPLCPQDEVENDLFNL